MLKQTQSQKMFLKLSPQQIQLMRLLQIPTSSLDERIKEEIEGNPALEEGDTYNEAEVFDLGDEFPQESQPEPKEAEVEYDNYLMDYIEDDSTGYKSRQDNYGQEEGPEQSMPVPAESSFHDTLMKQLDMIMFDNEKDEIIAKQLIGSIDEDGYLRREPVSIIDDILFAQAIEVTKKDVNRILKIIQRFDPPGVGARDLQECLVIQMEIKLSKPDIRNRHEKEVALKILKDSFEEFTKKHFHKLKKIHEISDSELRDIMEEILKLNPKPASGVEQEGKPNVQYVVPDFILTNRDGELELSLNSRNAPDLKISDHYTEMLRGFKANYQQNKVTKRDKEAVLFIKQKIDSAKWFIDAIRQRQETLLKVMYAIMRFQYDYLLTGDERKSRPMILKDIADIAGMDISTISRVANSKYVQTEFGTKKLKDFFSESVQTLDGKEVSTLEVKNIVSETIERENKKSPLNDDELTDLLLRRGYNIARRTVAKYREQLNIPVARLRKEI